MSDETNSRPVAYAANGEETERLQKKMLEDWHESLLPVAVPLSFHLFHKPAALEGVEQQMQRAICVAFGRGAHAVSIRVVAYMDREPSE
jgi:hypothetical protein